MQNIDSTLKSLLDENGKLPAVAWPGGYPIFYVDAESNALCPACANANDSYSPRIVASDINWEDKVLFCDKYCAPIESAYSD